jgi:pentose-5-phosphate-3-epimerase
MKNINHLKRIRFDSENRVDYAGYCLFLVGVLVFVLSVYSNMQTQKQIANIGEKISHFQNINTSKKRSRNDFVDPEREALANKISKQASYPWNAFFSTLESIHTSQVSLMSIVPSFEKKEVFVSAEAEDIHQMLKYIKLFERENNIERVELLNQALITDDQEGRISFSIKVKLL